MVRYKVVPPVRDVDFLYDAAAVLPLVPGSVEDCCTRLRDRTDLPSRDAAREILTFLEALGLAVQTERGYHREREPPDRDALETAFERHVFGVAEVLGALHEAEEPLTASQVFEAVSESVPHWERNRHADWEAVWRQRIERLLGWAVAFELAVESDERYELA